MPSMPTKPSKCSTYVLYEPTAFFIADGFTDEQQPVSTSLFRCHKYSKNLADTQSTRLDLYYDYKIDVR